jgi:hypothetical protein
LESSLNLLFTNTTEFIICGDVNINYLNDSYRKHQLDTLLSSYSLYSTASFTTKIQNISSSTIDSIFIDKMKNDHFTICPFVNGLSDHGAQILTLKNIKMPNQINYTCTVRKINKYSIAGFLTNLSYDSWDNIFIDDDVDTIFNHFLNTSLRIFYSSFSLRKVQSKSNNKDLITTGIKT